MQIEYRIPQMDYLSVSVIGDDGTGFDGPAVCLYQPQAVVGLKMIPVGRFTARGDSGRVEEATVQFDLRKGEFVIQPKKLMAGGFDFDKPVQPEVAEPTVETPVPSPSTPAVPSAAVPAGKK